MPPRPITLAIVAFWLAVTGLFVYHDVWPSLNTSEPTLFPIDLIDEAGRETDQVSWTVLKNGVDVYFANTDWRYVPADDSFESLGQLTRKEVNTVLEPPPAGGGIGPQFDNVNITNSSYRIARNGRMKRLLLEANYGLALPGSAPGERVRAVIEGSFAGEQFTTRLELSVPRLKGKELPGGLAAADLARTFGPAAPSHQGLVFDPLHPFRRAPDLRDGQHWRMVVIDPFAVVPLLGGALGKKAAAPLEAAGILPDQAAYDLDARVVPGSKALAWDGKDHPCRLITGSGDGPPVRSLTIWVRERDGVVLQQEVDLYADTWTFIRRAAGYRIAPPKLPQPGRVP
jgi:hypothetical protein